MDDSTLWRIWFAVAIVGAVLVTILPLFGISVD